jgi:hypothetical protein
MSPANRRKVPVAMGCRVRQRARHHCGYCLCSETLLGMPMEFDHLIPHLLIYPGNGLSSTNASWPALRQAIAKVVMEAMCGA